MKKFNIILACDLGGGIGFDNNLPWDFALDKKYFKTLTTNFFTNIKNILIMGRNTYRIFNNRGRNHGDPTDFNSISVFGPYFIQGTSNGPGTGGGQFYGMALGLGDDYGYASYALQLAIPRYGYNGSADRYLSIRNRNGRRDCTLSRKS